MTGATFDQALARELHGQELSCRQIAKQLGVAPSTISRWAEREGLSFDRFRTAAASQAHAVDLAAGRLRLAEKMLAATEEMLDTLDDPYVVYSFGGRDNTYEEHTFEDGAPVDVRKTVIQSAGVTFDRLTRIVERSNPELESAVGLLDLSASMFEAAAERLRARQAETQAEVPDAGAD